MQLLWCRTEPT